MQASIGGVVWWDYDGDGVRDKGDSTGIDGVALALYADDGDGLFEPGGDDPLQATTTSANGGAYLFEVRAKQSYWVDVLEESLPVGAAHVIGPESRPDPSLVTMRGSDISDVDFAYSYQGVISGAVFYDHNMDGVQGLGEEGAPDVDVCLYDDVNANGRLDEADSLRECIFTDSQGNYRFAGLFYGHYLVMESERPGISFSTPNIIPVFLDPWLVTVAQVHAIGMVRGDAPSQKLFLPFQLH